jgi:membrane fusion protein, heavy metal efflux system
MKKYIPMFMALLLMACHNTNENNELIRTTLRGDTVIINDRSIFLEKLRIETVLDRSFKMNLTISGIVRAIPNDYAEIASPFAGRITKSYVRLGQLVKIDDPIFEISSPSYYEAGKTYYQTRQEMQLAEKNLRRKKDLFANGVGIEKEVEEAEVAFDLASKEFENSVASLKVFRVKPEELVLGQPLIVRSPINGEIVENNIVLGQYLREDAKPVAIVAELSKIWVVGQLKEKDINSIRESDSVVIRLTGLPDIRINGRVYYISELLDEETRSVQVFIECLNSNRVMKPGMYVSAEFSRSNDHSILIPSSSVFQAEDNSYVFIQADSDMFVKRRIDIKAPADGSLIVKSGLKPGDRIVTKGGILLSEAR